MGEKTETLEQLALSEETLTELARNLEQLPGLIDEAENRAAEAKDRVQRDRDALEALERKRREREGALQDCETQRDKFRGQTTQVRTNTEYTALLHEIEGVTRKISQLEEEILVAMDELDEGRAKLVPTEQEQGQIEREFLERAKALRERLEQVRQEIKEREAERERWVASLDREVERHYRRIQGSLGTAIARMSGRSCSACHRDVPYETVNRVLAGEVHTCPSCHRILAGEPA
jgi:predicted  nucleic acid-binding Zn-ribbon protein